MLDRLTLPALVLIAAAMIALAMVWPQGQGARSPAPFGHPLPAVEKKIVVNGEPPVALRGAQSADPHSDVKAGRPASHH